MFHVFFVFLTKEQYSSSGLFLYFSVKVGVWFLESVTYTLTCTYSVHNYCTIPFQDLHTCQLPSADTHEEKHEPIYELPYFSVPNFE